MAKLVRECERVEKVPSIKMHVVWSGVSSVEGGGVRLVDLPCGDDDEVPTRERLTAHQLENFRAHRQFSLTLERTRLPIVNPRDAVLTLPYVARHDHSTYAA